MSFGVEYVDLTGTGVHSYSYINYRAEGHYIMTPCNLLPGMLCNCSLNKQPPTYNIQINKGIEVYR